MAQNRSTGQQDTLNALARARDELYSHILSCGVLDAEPEHQKDWLDDTMDYLEDRYESLAETELKDLRVLGERFCRPVIQPDEAATT